MEEIDIAVITKRSIQGVFALVSRTFFIQIISFTVNFLLTVFLSPEIFGIFFVVSAVITFLSYFSDVGLAAALIQKKETVTDEELKTTFTIQQLLVLFVSITALLLSDTIGKFYNLESDGILLFQALIVAFFLSSLKTIPSILLERNLHFQKLVIPQIVETLVFNVTVLILAIKGFGITSFTFAVLARGITGLLAMYLIQPWKIGFGFSKDSARRLLSFGVPFQANSFLALVKDDLLIVFLGKVLPLTFVGYIGFAQKWAFMPLRLIMDNVIRITFPSFSRLQHDAGALNAAIEKSIFAVSFFIFPSLAALIILSGYFIQLIPRYGKWEPALISLSFFALNAALSSVSTPLTNALNAIGKIKTTLTLMIFWTAATWLLTPLFILFFGFNGVSIASFIIAISVVLVVSIARKYVEFDIFKAIGSPFIATLFMTFFLYFLSPIVIKDFFTMALMIAAGGSIYIGVMFLLAKKQIFADIQLIKQNLRK